MSWRFRLGAFLQNEYLLAGMILLGLLFVLFPGYFLRSETLTTTSNLYGNYPWHAAAPSFRPQFVFDPTARVVSIPQEYIALEQIRAGIPPLWNPYVGNGAPLLATLMHAPFYPLKLLYYGLPFWSAIDVVWLLRLWLSGLGAYVLARRLGISRHGARVASIVYMMSSSQLIAFSMPIANVTAMFPWILAVVEKLLIEPTQTKKWMGVAGLLIGAQFLGGWPESSIYIATATALYVCVRAIQISRAPQQIVWTIIQVGIAGVLGLGIAAIQLLPLLAAWDEIFSVHIDPGTMKLVPLAQIAALGVPLFIGVPGKTWLVDDLVAPQTMLFVSSTAIVLAFVAIFQTRRTSPLVAIGIMTGAMLWLIFGLPGASFMFRFTPLGMALIEWGVFVVATGVAISAGAGLDAFVHQQLSIRKLLVAAGIWLAVLSICFAYNLPEVANRPQPLALIKDRITTTWTIFFILQNSIALVSTLAVCLIAWWHSRAKRDVRLASNLFFLLIAGQLWYNGFALNNTAPQFSYPSTPGIDFLKTDPTLFRISSVQRPETNWTTAPLVVQTASMFGLYDARNHDAIMPRYFLEFNSIAESGIISLPSHLASLFGLSNITAKRFLDLTNVKYLLDFPSKDFPDDAVTTQLLQAGWQLVWDQDMRIYRNPTVLPRAFIVHQAWSVQPGQSVTRLADPSFDPRRVAVIAGRVPDLPGGETTVVPTITRYEPLNVEIQVTLDKPGMLVLSDTYFPDWRATVDGLAAQIYRANHNFRAVYLTAGAHAITLWYDQTIFMLGTGTTLATFAICFGLIIATHRYTEKQCK